MPSSSSRLHGPLPERSCGANRAVVVPIRVYAGLRDFLVFWVSNIPVLAIVANFSIGLEILHLFPIQFLNAYLKWYIQHVSSDHTRAYRFRRCVCFLPPHLPGVLNNHIGFHHSDCTSHFLVLIAHCCIVFLPVLFISWFTCLLLFCICLMHVHTFFLSFLSPRNEMRRLLVTFQKISIVCSFTWTSLEISPAESLEKFAQQPSSF